VSSDDPDEQRHQQRDIEFILAKVIHGLLPTFVLYVKNSIYFHHHLGLLNESSMRLM
jgi:hypothetical protein